MAREIYSSIGKSVTGFSFANLGLFTGFADGIYNAVYALVILEIFRSSAVVGVYVAMYSVFCMCVALFANELFRRFSKVKVFYYAAILLISCYLMMSFSVLPRTFIVLDWTSGISSTLIAILIPLFMSDFSSGIGMARLNSRYHLWANIGALFAPMIAVFVANQFGNRSAFFVSAMIYLACLFFFKFLRVEQPDKIIKPIEPRKTFRALFRNAVAFFKTPGMVRAYFINFSHYSVRSLRLLYVPIVVIEAGFSKDALGWVLTLGIIPYIVLAAVMGNLVKKYGKRLWLILGFGSFAAIAAFAAVASGYPLLAAFVLWQVSGALIEPVHDLLFFDGTKKSQQARFYGVFRTSANLPSVLMPIVAAAVITMVGTTTAVWWISATVAALATLVVFTIKR